MNRHMQSAVVFAVERMGLGFILNQLRKSDKLLVLLCHDVKPDADVDLGAPNRSCLSTTEFSKSIRFLKRYFTFVNVQQVHDYYHKGAGLPRNPILLTLDDGWYGCRENVLGILREHEVPAVVFVITRTIDDPGYIPINCIFHPIKDDMQKKLARHMQGQGLKADDEVKAHDDLFQALPRIVQQEVIRDAGYNIKLSEGRRLFVSADDMAVLKESHIDMGSHSVTHVPLTLANDLAFELAESKRTLEKIVGGEIAAISYPHGEYDNNVMNKASQAGYRLGFCSDKGVNDKGSNPMCLKRIELNWTRGRYASPEYFIIKTVFMRSG